MTASNWGKTLHNAKEIVARYGAVRIFACGHECVIAAPKDLDALKTGIAIGRTLAASQKNRKKTIDK